jgi:hypothetical protein
MEGQLAQESRLNGDASTSSGLMGGSAERVHDRTTASSSSPPGGRRQFLVGEAGGDHIRNELSTKPPKKVFEEIQHSYGLQLPHEECAPPPHSLVYLFLFLFY